MWAAYANTAIEIPLPEATIPKGNQITISKGRNEKYAIWHWSGVYDLPENFVDESTIKPFTNPESWKEMK